jgi:hypothetical protein
MSDVATGKNLIVTKVYDNNCDVCKHMSKHDRAVYSEFPEISYQEIDLDGVINHENDLTKLRLYQCLERYALNNDYTIDLPVYVYLTKQGKYEGHHIGAATIVELRDKTKEILEDCLPE